MRDFSPKTASRTSPSDGQPPRFSALGLPVRAASHAISCLCVPKIRIREAAAFLNVSDDTVRRWIDVGMLPVETDESNRKVIDGYALAKFAQSQAAPMHDPSQVGRSARNRFVGLVTDIVVDKVMAQVELQCGPLPSGVADVVAKRSASSVWSSGRSRSPWSSPPR